MSAHKLFINSKSLSSKNTARYWQDFLEKNNFDFNSIEKIDMLNECPVIFDKLGNKFSIDFVNNKLSYVKPKGSIKMELISKAMGSGKHGLRLLDLSAGLAIDAVFLAQLGYAVTALERNPLIYLALSEALQKKPEKTQKLNLEFIFIDAIQYLKNQTLITDVIYFDPMFPEKIKSALPKQEMVFFKKLVGPDEDATEVLRAALKVKGIKRVVVKRPRKALALLKPMASIEGKLIRFDLYSGAK